MILTFRRRLWTTDSIMGRRLIILHHTLRGYYFFYSPMTFRSNLMTLPSWTNGFSLVFLFGIDMVWFWMWKRLSFLTWVFVMTGNCMRRLPSLSIWVLFFLKNSWRLENPSCLRKFGHKLLDIVGELLLPLLLPTLCLREITLRPFLDTMLLHMFLPELSLLKLLSNGGVLFRKEFMALTLWFLKLWLLASSLNPTGYFGGTRKC